mmetsp:Transcript_19752/g.33945  ORF Transcript_19752/g.33945 Transcript_19752/m.33945 type:complete len:217 (-) Transcript_19752:439-1089(-)
MSSLLSTSFVHDLTAAAPDVRCAQKLAEHGASVTDPLAIKVGILTVSDSCSSGAAVDKSGPACVEFIEANLQGAKVTATAVVPDDVNAIQAVLKNWSDNDALHLILTTGGTGFAPRDVTPEATKPLLDKEAPGIVIAMMMASLQATPTGILSRPAAGIRKHTVIINLPGSPKAVKENLAPIVGPLLHGIRLATVSVDPHPTHSAAHTHSGCCGSSH